MATTVVILNDDKSFPRYPRLRKSGPDKVLWVAVDGDYDLNFTNGSPFDGPDQFTVELGNPKPQSIREGADVGRYKYNMTVPSTEVIDPTIFIDL